MDKTYLAVDSARARELALTLSWRYQRSIDAIIEDALLEYAERHHPATTADFLRDICVNDRADYPDTK